MPDKDAPYTQSKIRSSVLREAVQKVFSYKPSGSKKKSIDPPAAKHRKRARSGPRAPTHAS